ncbi:hypothetical protein AQUCO_06200001v1, partial [Aquilegia coerulea]
SRRRKRLISNFNIKVKKMVCLACLLPLFFIPIINALPLLFDFLMGKLYLVMGWEYKKPERVPPACPYKPPVASSSSPLI